MVTEKEHAEELLLLLNRPKPCSRCPWNTNLLNYARCDRCRAFVDLPPYRQGFENLTIYKCPCNCLGAKESIKRTWIALEEGGYLE